MGLIQAASDWVLLLISLFSSKASGFQLISLSTITALVPANMELLTMLQIQMEQSLSVLTNSRGTSGPT